MALRFRILQLKKARIKKDFWAIMGFILLMGIFFYDVVFLDYTLLTSGPPIKPYHVIDPISSSAYYEPLIQLTSRIYKSGQIPLWNPHSSLGIPLNAIMESAVFFPLYFLLFWNPSPKMWDFFILLRFFIAGVLAYWFFRRFLKLESFAAFVGAAAFMFCGHLVLNLNLVYINTVMLLPGLLYVSELLVENPGLKTLSLTGLLIGLAILGGHPEPTFFALFYTGIYFLFRTVQEAGNQESKVRFLTFGFRLLTSGCWFVGATLLGFALSAITLLPFTEFLRIANLGIHDDRYFRVGLEAVSPSHLFGLWVPYFWGPLLQTTWDNSNWQLFPGYIGIMVVLMILALGFQGLAFRGKALFFTLMVLFFLLKAYRLWPAFHIWVGGYLPIFRVSFFTRYFTGEFMFSTAALAGIFLQQWKEGRIRIRYLALSAFLGLLSLVLLLGLHYTVLREQNKLDYALQQVQIPALLCLLTGIGTGVLWKKPLFLHLILPVFLGFLLILELFIWLPKAHYKRSQLYSYANPPPHIKFIKQEPGVFRVYGLHGFLFPTTASGYGLDDFGAIDGLFNSLYVTFVRELIRPYKNFYITGISVPDVENRFFSLLNLKYVITNPGAPPPAPFFTLVFWQDACVYRNENAFPRAFIVHRAEIVPNLEAAIKRLKEASFDLRRRIILERSVEDPAMLTGYQAPEVDESTAEIVKYTPTRIVIKAHLEHAGFLVLSDPYFPGWKVFVDGQEKKMYLTDALIRSVFVDPGVHTVEFVYQPVSYKLGAWLTLLGCGTVAALWTWVCCRKN
ncbi:MAG TPA: YfhO family protein [Candidatus Limnocylindrales bacterium]|nr:YfhO family protein [Candidatus Limnocylindrales bacterium]